MRKLLSRQLFAAAWRTALSATPVRTVYVSGFASSRVPSGMAVLDVRDSEALIEELAEAYVNMDLATLVQFQQAATQRMAGEGKSLNYEEMLLQGMGGGGGAAVATPAAAAATSATAGAATPGGDAAAAASKKVVEKLAFDVTLKKYPAENKIKLIKELRSICPMPIPEAKAAIEKCPGVIAKNVAKADAEKLKAVMTGLGGEVELV